MEKERVLQNQRKKIRPEELETVALKVPLETYKRFKYTNEEDTDEETDEDKKIEDAQNYFYYHTDFLDFSLKDGQGRTNLQRLKQNLNPIGKDGYSMEVHHLTMFNESILVLVSRTLHEGISLKNLTLDDKANLHPQPAYYGHSGRSDIDRRYFKKVLKKIFQKLVEKADVSRPSLPPVKRRLNF